MNVTQGEWFVTDNTERGMKGLNTVAEVGDFAVCVDGDIEYGDDKDDAALISAAADMYKALKALEPFLPQDPGMMTSKIAHVEAANKARAAISKAEGDNV